MNAQSDQSSIFNHESFLDATTTEQSTKRPPIPAGTELQGTITKVASRAWQGKKDPTQGGVAVDLTVEFDLNAAPPGVKQAVGNVDKVQIIDGFILDLTASGSIDYSPGKNNKLRRYREATGLNEPGQPFSVRMFDGRTLRCKIKHEPYEGDLYDKIDSVAKV